MSLVKTTGNMYPWITHRWNPIKGKCPHDCSYCYVKRWGNKQRNMYLDEKELRADLGKCNFIFVGSGTDMWAWGTPDIDGTIDDQLYQVIKYIQRYPENKYFFQSKNPARFLEWLKADNFYFCATIESDIYYPGISDAPSMNARAEEMQELANMGRNTVVTIEPIINFYLESFTDLIRSCCPEWVNIGADSGGHKLPEPEPAKVKKLIAALSEFTEVKQKENLKRLLNGGKR